ncbi:hypothetical protein LSH36_222g03006 [Paralvinella palmiformis]|uniref:G-protein coupled receptors family 1 profile domain-containing protein n=1 Tax=Paralvinella palmiformis TaxID=53620 RepID=A0AAD9JN57_9ANNE|nr:hypothetical protein LSH36_222g03006 [Paralvinella palmiformis]
MGLTIIAFNGVFIAAIMRNESLRTLENVLLIKLSCFDILAGVSVIVNSTANIFTPVPFDVCLFSACIIGIAFLGSLYSLLGVTMERYIKVCHPFVYLRLATIKTMTTYVVSEGLLLIMLLISTAILSKATISESEQRQDKRCMPLRFTDHSLGAQVITNVAITIPLLVSTLIYLRLAWIAHKQRSIIRTLTVVPRSMSRNDGRQMAEGKLPSERKRINMVGIILFMHYISFVPTLFNSFIVNMATVSLTLAIVSKVIREISNAFVYLNSVVNPVIYAFRNTDIKMAILKLLKKRLV